VPIQCLPFQIISGQFELITFWNLFNLKVLIELIEPFINIIPIKTRKVMLRFKNLIVGTIISIFTTDIE
jgi:hypothetical protein